MKIGVREDKQGFTFPWHQQYRLPWTVMLFVVVSVFLHALSFYVFQVVYPTPSSLRIPAARLTLVNLDRPENAQLKNWIEAENPAHGMTGLVVQDVAVQDFLSTDHVPSFASASPQIMRLSPTPSAVLPKAYGPYSALVRPRRAPLEAELPSFEIPPVQVFSAVELVLPPDAEFSPPLLQETMYPVIVVLSFDEIGNVTNAFLTQSSGDAGADRYALSLIRRAALATPLPAAPPRMTTAHIVFHPTAGTQPEDAP